jgi:hypothetical protein
MSDGDAARAQTLPDFVVGIAIFLLAITFVVQVVPQLALPYEDQEQPVAVQRAAANLENQLLADGGTPSRLNQTCTLTFFKQNSSGGCPFDTGNAVTEQLGLSTTYSVNVTLRTLPSDDPASTLLCDVGDTVDSCGGSDVRLGVGSAVPSDDRSVALARRRVVVGDREAVLEVGVW